MFKHYRHLSRRNDMQAFHVARLLQIDKQVFLAGDQYA